MRWNKLIQIGRPRVIARINVYDLYEIDKYEQHILCKNVKEKKSLTFLDSGKPEPFKMTLYKKGMNEPEEIHLALL